MDIFQEKSYAFALRVVRLSEYLNNEKKEFILSKKILDSGTNIGLLIEEGKQGESRVDFIQKYSVANIRGVQNKFLVTAAARFAESSQAESLLADCEELQKLLISALKTARKSE